MRFVLLTLLMSISPLTEGKIEPLYGVTVGDAVVNVKVKSQGCTKASDFAVAIRHHRLIITRIKPDNCRAKAKLIELALPLRNTFNKPKLYNPIYLSLEPVFAKNSSY